MKYYFIGALIILLLFVPKKVQAEEISACGALAGAFAVYSTATIPGRVGAVITYIAGLGGYAAGSSACDVGSILEGENAGAPPSIANQIREAMCPTGDCATADPLPPDPADCFLEINCAERALPDEQWISPNDFLNAAIFVDERAILGHWPWTASDLGDLMQP